MRASTAARIATALGATLVLATGCAPSAPVSTRTVSIADARSSADPSATTSDTASMNSLVKVSYDTWGFTAMHPDAWRSYPYEFIGTLVGTIGYLSTDTLTNPCRRTANSISCDKKAVLERLSTDGVLIRWGEVGMPLIRSISDFPGDPMTVDGSPARLVNPSLATQDCRAAGGAVQIPGTVLRPDAGANFLQLDACIGPDAGKAAELDVDALFRSIDFVD